MQNLFEELATLNHDMEEVELIYDNSIQQDADNVIQGNVNFNNLDLDCDGTDSCNLENVNANNMNGEDMEEFLRNIYHLSDQMEISPTIEFEDIIIDAEINPTIVNGHGIGELIHTKGDDILVIDGNFEINGNVQFDSLGVGNVIHNVKIDNENVLLTEGDQELGAITAESLEIKNLLGSIINDLKFENEIKDLQNTTLLAKKKLFDVVAQNLIVGDSINDIDIEFLNKNALRKNGNQDISG